jgi:hypothetical protein
MEMHCRNMHVAHLMTEIRQDLEPEPLLRPEHPSGGAQVQGAA